MSWHSQEEDTPEAKAPPLIVEWRSRLGRDLLNPAREADHGPEKWKSIDEAQNRLQHIIGATEKVFVYGGCVSFGIYGDSDVDFCSVHPFIGRPPERGHEERRVIAVVGLLARSGLDEHHLEAITKTRWAQGPSFPRTLICGKSFREKFFFRDFFFPAR